MKGLTFRKTADAIAAFVKQHGAVGPRRAVFCTYDLSPARFEAVVLPVAYAPTAVVSHAGPRGRGGTPARMAC